MDASFGAFVPTAPAQPQQKTAAAIAVRVDPTPLTPAADDRPQAFSSAIESDLDRTLSSQRDVTLDVATGSLVYRLIDVTTGVVSRQTPSEDRLKLRAYIDGVIAANASPPSVERTA